MDSTDGKVIIITGAGSGIGKATAFAFSRKGANVVLADIDPDKGNQVAEEIRREGGKAIFVKTDVSETGEVKAMVDKAVEVYGKLDYAFNNAGIAMEFAPVHEASEEAWDRVIAVNLTGVWACMKYEIPYMLKNRKGAIVNMSSIHGFSGMRGHYAYAASKHGVIRLTKTMALELRAHNIRVNAICPSFIDTDLTTRSLELLRSEGVPIDDILVQQSVRLGTPEEVANLALFLASDESSFVNGASVAIDNACTTQ